jgi:hypothetical protein
MVATRPAGPEHAAGGAGQSGPQTPGPLPIPWLAPPALPRLPGAGPTRQSLQGWVSDRFDGHKDKEGRRCRPITDRPPCARWWRASAIATRLFSHGKRRGRGRGAIRRVPAPLRQSYGSPGRCAGLRHRGEVPNSVFGAARDVGPYVESARASPNYVGLFPTGRMGDPPTPLQARPGSPPAVPHLRPFRLLSFPAASNLTGARTNLLPQSLEATVRATGQNPTTPQRKREQAVTSLALRLRWANCNNPAGPFGCCRSSRPTMSGAAAEGGPTPSAPWSPSVRPSRSLLA